MSFHIMNSDLADFGYSPRATKRGDTIEVTKPVQACPWKPSDADTIPVGTYQIINRKGFVGGSQEVDILP